MKLVKRKADQSFIDLMRGLIRLDIL